MQLSNRPSLASLFGIFIFRYYLSSDLTIMRKGRKVSLSRWIQRVEYKAIVSTIGAEVLSGMIHSLFDEFRNIIETAWIARKSNRDLSVVFGRNVTRRSTPNGRDSSSSRLIHYSKEFSNFLRCVSTLYRRSEGCEAITTFKKLAAERPYFIGIRR